MLTSIQYCKFCVMCHMSCVMCHASCNIACVMTHVSCVMCHVSCVMCHVSCVMRHASCVMRHASCVMRHASCVMRHAIVQSLCLMGSLHSVGTHLYQIGSLHSSLLNWQFALLRCVPTVIHGSVRAKGCAARAHLVTLAHI